MCLRQMLAYYRYISTHLPSLGIQDVLASYRLLAKKLQLKKVIAALFLSGMQLNFRLDFFQKRKQYEP